MPKTKYHDITSYPFLHKDKKSIVYCELLADNPYNCRYCPCPDCYATCPPTQDEWALMNELHNMERKFEKLMKVGETK